VQSAFVAHGEPYVAAAVAPSECDPPSLPLLEPPSLPPLDPELDPLPELLPLEGELPELLPDPLLLVLPPLLLLPDDEELVLDPDDPLPPELELGLMPGDVCPPELEFWNVGEPPPVSSELHAQRHIARAAIAAAVGPVDVRRIVWAPIASTGPTLLSPAVAVPVQRRCANRAE